MPTNATMVAADGAWTLQSLNTAVEGRYTLGAMLAQANVQSSSIIPMVTWRSGVIPSSSWGSQVYDLLVAPQATPALSLQVYRGCCVISRSGQGPYLCYNSTVKNVAVDAGDATNPRQDLIVARVYDSAIGDTSTGFALEVVPGTPAPSPSDPTVPTGAIPLARISVGVNASSISSANITDLRTSTSMPGAMRTLLGGDSTSMTSGGYMIGEMRFRKAAGSLPDLIDFWGSDGNWHTLNDKLVCRVQLQVNAPLGANANTYAQGNWSGYEDPYGMFRPAPANGTYAYIQIPVTGRYRIGYLSVMNPSSGGVTVGIAKNSAATSADIARDNRVAVTQDGGGTWAHAMREVNLTAGDKLFWENWSSAGCTILASSMSVPTEMSVRFLGN